ncbi:SAM hydrolase/SAM-dependent halogenase family protein [Capnocytophaga felis]|uniref:SAM hydrolase/SAM-dependent halogenase family protein n=1 Tax=Capnocytophaga felis TaxID=2267611 RepID=UPI0012D36088|nr:SAM-dependent chlorinase/fluorinase [Capnocytophaga felis]
MKIITLTTDFGERDYSVGAVKGAIYSNFSQAHVVDISHLITPFDVLQTAYILKNAYVHFPKGTIHIVGVDSERTPEKKHLIMYLNGHYFIGADNGIFHLLSENEKDVEVYEIGENEPVTLFPALDFFPKIVAKIGNEIPLDKIGKKTDDYLKISYLKPEISRDKSFIYGNIIYIDHYGNAVSNISRSLFDEIGQNRNFEVIFKMYSFHKIHNLYTDIIDFKIPKENRAPEGRKLLLFNSTDLLQISIYKSDLSSLGGASTLLGMECFDNVTVHFFE